MKLIIAEKPMLARAIAAAIPGSDKKENGYITKGEYTIISAFGHLLTLKDPEDYDPKYKFWSLKTLPIYFENWGKKPGEDKKERLDLIGKLLTSADCVIHAGDPDDEGQYLIDEILEWFNYQGPVYRLSTGDTTEAALAKALNNLKDNKDFVNFGKSAYARSVADIMVGYNFSRYFSLLNSHVKMLTVGRVQTPTLGLVVTRDMQIENHTKQAFYSITADVKINDSLIKTKFEPAKDNAHLEDGRIADKDYADSVLKVLDGANFNDAVVSNKELTEQPPLPFNLVKLQTYCSNKFGYEPSKTLEITQSLRDKHNAITYNRSDCQYLSEEQYKESPATLKRVLENLEGDAAGAVFKKLPLNTALHSNAFNDKNITAHTAIIPQNRKLDLKKLSEEERNVYLAIAKYFFAQFLAPAKKNRTTLEITTDDGALKAVSTKIVIPGFLQLIKPEKKKDSSEENEDDEKETDLSSIDPGTYNAAVSALNIEAKETKAPPRYTKASLNEDMTRIAKYVKDPKAKALLLSKDKDKKGENGSIGTSATRSFIIDNLEARGFIESKGRKIQSTALGRELCRILPDELKKPDMTGYWWAIQEEICSGETQWTNLTDSVLEMIKKVIKTSYPKIDAYHVPESFRKGRLSLGSCPRCGAPIIEGKTAFGCSNFEKCDFRISKKAESGMMSKTEISADIIHTLLEAGWTEEIKTKEDGTSYKTGKRRTVNTVLIKKLYSENKKISFAGNVYINDAGPSANYGPSFAISEIVNEEAEVIGICPRCGKNVVEGKLGFGCTGYADGCKFTIWKKQKQKMLAKITFTKTDAKKFLQGKPVHKKNLLDKKEQVFEADLVMEEKPDNPFGPVFRVVAGSICVKDGDPSIIKIDTTISSGF